jgi:uncharacterized metal-binding protein
MATVKPQQKYVFSCSGAADVGAIADFSARALARDYNITLACITCINSGQATYLDQLKQATIIAIDGCGEDCTKVCHAKAGFRADLHIRLTDEGFEKGRSPSTPIRVNQVAKLVRNRLRMADSRPKKAANE